MAATTANGWASAGHRHHAEAGIPQSVAVTAARLAVGLTGQFTAPVLFISTLSGLCAAQLALSLSRSCDHLTTE
jgi:hypothetical protein